MHIVALHTKYQTRKILLFAILLDLLSSAMTFKHFKCDLSV